MGGAGSGDAGCHAAGLPGARGRPRGPRGEEPASACPRPKHVRIIGVGPGDPDQVTIEAVHALREVAYFVVTDKSGRGGMPDPLVNARERLLDRHLEESPVIVRVDDPERERRPDRTATQEEYDAAVARWHEERQTAYEEALLSHDGDAGFLVWGDPAFYDSTIRILQSLQERGRLDLDTRRHPGHLQHPAARCAAPDRAARGRSGAARHQRPTAARGARAGAGQHRRDAQPGDRARRPGRTGRSGGAPTSAPRPRSWSRAASATCCRRSTRRASGCARRPAG